VRAAPSPAAPSSSRLRAGSLCTGYGGLDIGVTAVLDAEVAWYAETDPHAAAVLAARWPGLRNLGDITALDWAAVPPVDLITAGWPCQDISYAGPGTGITKGTRSGLWLHIADGLRQLRPSYVFLENVAALRTRGLPEVIARLAEIGYDTQWTSLRAADTGACHRRDRIFILAARPGTAARLAAAAHPDSRMLQRRRTGGILAGPPGPAEGSWP
jgi:DNA (cytosine-5)-methyltransferase 1